MFPIKSCPLLPGYYHILPVARIHNKSKGPSSLNADRMNLLPQYLFPKNTQVQVGFLPSFVGEGVGRFYVLYYVKYHCKLTHKTTNIPHIPEN